MNLQEIVRFLQVALECSVYLAPLDPGLSYAEISEVGKRAGLQGGEIEDALPGLALSHFGGSKRLLPAPNALWIVFSIPQVPEYRSIAAFDFMHSQFNASLRAEGKRNARLERSVIVERAIAANIPPRDIEAAITISVMCDLLVDKDGVLSSKSGMVYEPLPSQQQSGQQASKPMRNEMRERAHAIVNDVIERRTDGRPKHAEPFDAFSDALDLLSYGPFRLWWTQLVAELRHSTAQSSPLSTLVLAAALVEGALTFVVQHARAKGLGVFRSSDFAGDPRTWKIEDLIKSAASGSESTILDERTRLRASALVQTRQRIHAGRMLSEYPSGGMPDLRPEEARDAKATAEQVVRHELNRFGKYPST